MLRNVLLSVHLVAVIAWLGVGLYELFLYREIRRARGTPLEVSLIQIYGRYSSVVALATLVVAAAGLLMSLLLGWGFFQQLWLGLKQAIMLLVLLDMALLVPTFRRAYAEIALLSTGEGIAALERCRTTLENVHRHVLPMRLGALVAVLLAVWRPV